MNNLSLNIQKTKLLICLHKKSVSNINIHEDGKWIDCVTIFNILAIDMNEKLDWKPHINMIAIKISKSNDILN